MDAMGCVAHRQRSSTQPHMLGSQAPHTASPAMPPFPRLRASSTGCHPLLVSRLHRQGHLYQSAQKEAGTLSYPIIVPRKSSLSPCLPGLTLAPPVILMVSHCSFPEFHVCSWVRARLPQPFAWPFPDKKEP